MDKQLYFSGLFFLSALLSTTMETCAGEGAYDTTPLHNLTANIQESKEYILEVRDTIRSDKCSELKEMDAILAQEEKLFKEIQSWVTDSVKNKISSKKIGKIKVKDFLDLDGRIIKKTEIKYPNEKFGRWFYPEAQKLQNRLVAFDDDIRRYQKILKRCVRRHNICEALLDSGSNDWRVKSIRKGLKLDEELEVKKAGGSSLSSRDSSKVSRYVEDHKRYDKLESWKSQLFTDLQLAIIYQLKYKVTHDTAYCGQAHNRWNAVAHKYFDKEYTCEKNFLEEESQKWGQHVTVNKQYIKQQQDGTRNCASHSKGCKSECAINYDSTVVYNNGLCLGCMDSLATNFCPEARSDEGAKCKYLVCPDTCFNNFVDINDFAQLKAKFSAYNPNKDSVEIDIEICAKDICGCTNENCTAFDPVAEKDDGSCNCGCLDPAKANYLPRELQAVPFKGMPLQPKNFFDPNSDEQIEIRDSMMINGTYFYHDPTACNDKGCMSPYAENYNPYASINDGSCICKNISREELLAYYRMLRGQLAMDVPGIKDLKKEFNAITKNAPDSIKHILDKVKISQEGNDLMLMADVRITNKIKSELVVDGIPLGAYTFPALYGAVDFVIDFVEEQVTDLDQFSAILVGEADGHPIGQGGIAFKNNGFDIINEKFRSLGQNIDTDIESVKNPAFNTNQKDKTSISDGGRIDNNVELAFVRAFLVKQRILESTREGLKSEQVNVCAKANESRKRGKKYRKVAMVFTIEDFFLENGRTDDELEKEAKAAEEAIEYYEEHGYPNEGNTYEECPPLEWYE